MVFLFLGYYRRLVNFNMMISWPPWNAPRVTSYQQGGSLFSPSAASLSSCAPLPTHWRFVPTGSMSPPPGGKGWRRRRSWTLRRNHCCAWSHSWSAETCCLSPEACNKDEVRGLLTKDTPKLQCILHLVINMMTHLFSHSNIYSHCQVTKKEVHY